MIWRTLGLTTWILLLWAIYKAPEKLKDAILTHDRYMLEGDKVRRETAKFEAIKACSKKRFLPVCKEME